jgi:hypothetical protein
VRPYTVCSRLLLLHEFSGFFRRDTSVRALDLRLAKHRYPCRAHARMPRDLHHHQDSAMHTASSLTKFACPCVSCSAPPYPPPNPTPPLSQYSFGAPLHPEPHYPTPWHAVRTHRPPCSPTGPAPSHGSRAPAPPAPAGGRHGVAHEPQRV